MFLKVYLKSHVVASARRSALGHRPRIRGSRRHNYFTLGYAEGGSSLLKADSVSA